MIGHEAQTRGGWLGHLLRRLVHIGMIVVPYLYYQYGASISAFFDLSPRGLLWSLLALVILLELLRLSLGIQLFGQREYEAGRLSSFAWGGVSLFLVLLLAPEAFAYPIVASCALGDPLIGEMRRFHLSPWFIALMGMILIAGLWLMAGYCLAVPWWWAVIMGPLTVGAEHIRWKWIDDNATMQLIPLLCVLFVGFLIRTAS